MVARITILTGFISSSQLYQRCDISKRSLMMICQHKTRQILPYRGAWTRFAGWDNGEADRKRAGG